MHKHKIKKENSTECIWPKQSSWFSPWTLQKKKGWFPLMWNFNFWICCSTICTNMQIWTQDRYIVKGGFVWDLGVIVIDLWIFWWLRNWNEVRWREEELCLVSALSRIVRVVVGTVLYIEGFCWSRSLSFISHARLCFIMEQGTGQVLLVW